MKILDLLHESYSDITKIFSKENDPTLVKAVVERFKKLAQANRLGAGESDITKWVRRPFKELSDFVDSKERVVSKKQVKNANKKDALTVMTKGSWVVIMPLTKSASIQYGKGTKWCTAARNDNAFNSHFGDGGALVYFIDKEYDEKYACEIDIVNNKVHGCYDERDSYISYADVADATSIGWAELVKNLDNGSKKHVIDVQYGETAAIEKEVANELGLIKNLKTEYESVLQKLNSKLIVLTKNMENFVGSDPNIHERYLKYIQTKEQIGNIMNANSSLYFLHQFYNQYILHGKDCHLRQWENINGKLRDQSATEFMVTNLSAPKIEEFNKLKSDILDNVDKIRTYK